MIRLRERENRRGDERYFRLPGAWGLRFSNSIREPLGAGLGDTDGNLADTGQGFVDHCFRLRLDLHSLRTRNPWNYLCPGAFALAIHFQQTLRIRVPPNHSRNCAVI